MLSDYQLVIFDWEGTVGDCFGRALMPGVDAFINTLKLAGLKLAVATNKEDTSLKKDLIHFDLLHTFNAIRTANQTAPKPDPQMIIEILEETQTPPQAAIMIGDSESDMAMATQVGVLAIGIDPSGRYASLLKSAGASAVFQDYAAIEDYLSKEREG